MNPHKLLPHALKWKHPKAAFHTRNGKILAWNDPDSVEQPDEATIISEYSIVHTDGIPKPAIIIFEDFQGRFTKAEWEDVAALTISNKKVHAAILARRSVDLENAEVITFVDALVSGDVITAQRKMEILKP